LLDYGLGGGTGEEVEVEDPAEEAVLDEGLVGGRGRLEEDVGAGGGEEEDAVRGGGLRGGVEAVF
jgi:hypothetical protein